MKTGLVLGGGGVVGLAYHAGVLRALEVEGGFRPDDADLIVGTSAGSVVGAYLRSGWSTEDFWQLAMGTHPQLGAIGGDEAPVLSPSFRTPLDVARRGLGAAWVLSRSLVRVPTGPLPAFLGHLFPGGFFAMTEGKRRFEAELAAEWPERDLWLTTYDIVRGRRVVLGAAGRTPPPLHRAVRASCAIPGVYSPVGLGPLTLVDGGVWSTTNLDLASRAGCDLIICVAPMAYDRDDAPRGVLRAAREVPQRMLGREAAAAKRRGAQVLLLRPTAAEVREHGVNLMRPEGLERVTQMAYDATRWALAAERFRTPLDLLAA